MKNFKNIQFPLSAQIRLVRLNSNQAFKGSRITGC